MKRRAPSCCDTTAKILLIIFNIIFWAFGVAILGVGIWIKTDPELSNLGQAVKVGDSEPIVEIITWLFIGAGIFVFAVGVVGLIGIIRESKIMMGFYIVCVFIVFAAEASAGVYAGVRKDYLIEKIEEEGAKFLKTKYTSDPGQNNEVKAAYYLVSKGFNYVQVTKNCCGVKDFMDYKNSTYLQELGSKINAGVSMSWACCSTVNTVDDAFKDDGRLKVDADVRGKCMADSLRAVNAYDNSIDAKTGKQKAKDLCKGFTEFECEQGCVEALMKWTDENLIVMVAIAIAIGLSQLILLFLALWFCQALGRDGKQ